MAILDARAYDTRGRARSFTWSNILFRAVWNATWLLLAAWTPPQLYGWRRFLLRLFGATIGRGVRVYGSARIWYPPHLTMGEGAILGPGSWCYCMAPITFAPHANAAQRVSLVAGTHDVDDPHFQLRAHPITLGEHSWLAANSFVGPGVTIGEGAVLGACGVAFKNLEPWTIYAGNPAREIRKRRPFTLPGAERLPEAVEQPA